VSNFYRKIKKRFQMILVNCFAENLTYQLHFLSKLPFDLNSENKFKIIYLISKFWSYFLCNISKIIIWVFGDFLCQMSFIFVEWFDQLTWYFYEIMLVQCGIFFTNVFILGNAFIFGHYPTLNGATAPLIG
jgi:hypothetical protein